MLPPWRGISGCMGGGVDDPSCRLAKSHSLLALLASLSLLALPSLLAVPAPLGFLALHPPLAAGCYREQAGSTCHTPLTPPRCAPTHLPHSHTSHTCLPTPIQARASGLRCCRRSCMAPAWPRRSTPHSASPSCWTTCLTTGVLTSTRRRSWHCCTCCRYGRWGGKTQLVVLQAGDSNERYTLVHVAAGAVTLCTSITLHPSLFWKLVLA